MTGITQSNDAQRTYLRNLDEDSVDSICDFLDVQSVVSFKSSSTSNKSFIDQRHAPIRHQRQLRQLNVRVSKSITEAKTSLQLEFFVQKALEKGINKQIIQTFAAQYPHSHAQAYSSIYAAVFDNNKSLMVLLLQQLKEKIKDRKVQFLIRTAVRRAHRDIVNYFATNLEYRAPFRAALRQIQQDPNPWADLEKQRLVNWGLTAQ